MHKPIRDIYLIYLGLNENIASMSSYRMANEDDFFMVQREYNRVVGDT